MKQKKHRSSTRILSKAKKTLTSEMAEFNFAIDKLPDTNIPCFPIPEYFEGNLIVNQFSMSGKSDFSRISALSEMEFQCDDILEAKR